MVALTPIPRRAIQPAAGYRIQIRCSTPTSFHKTLPMLIRELLPSDAAAFQTLRLQGLRECPSAFASSWEEECDTETADIAASLVGTTDRFLLGAFLGEDLVGLLGLQREEMAKLSHKGIIWGVYVAPAARRKGVGRLLFDKALARAAAMPGLRQINLSVNAANSAAIALYESLGFEQFGLERACMLVDGELHDEIHMVSVLAGG